MTTLLALLILAQSAPAVEKSGLLEYRRPAGWTGQDAPDGCRALLPQDGSGAVIRFLQPEPWAGTGEAYHEALHAVICQGAPIRSGGKPETFGGFLRSEAVVGAEGSPAVRIALYTAKAGDHYQGVFFAAPSDEIFQKHRDAADGLVRAIELPGARERTATLELTLPRGWRREDEPAQGTTTFLPAGLAPPLPLCGLMVLPSKASAATADEHHDQTWAALTATATLSEKPQESVKGAFRSTRVQLKNAQGQDAWLILYTAKQGAMVETLLFAASLKAHYEKHGPEADAMVSGITFPSAAVPTLSNLTPGSGRVPRAIPTAGRDVKLLGLWINGETSFRYGVDWGGGFGARMRSSIYILALWENGIAYRGVYNAPIFTDTGLMGVPEGLAAVDAADLAAQPKFEDTRFSRWTEKGGVVDIPENWHGALKLTREGTAFKSQDGAKWIRLDPVDGLRLDGTYVGAATAAAPEVRLIFRKDGTFETSNLVHALGGPTNNPRFPMQGKGTYEFRKWSLILRFDCGYTQALVFLMNGQGLADARGIILAGAELVRR